MKIRDSNIYIQRGRKLFSPFIALTTLFGQRRRTGWTGTPARKAPDIRRQRKKCLRKVLSRQEAKQENETSPILEQFLHDSCKRTGFTEPDRTVLLRMTLRFLFVALLSPQTPTRLELDERSAISRGSLWKHEHLEKLLHL